MLLPLTLTPGVRALTRNADDDGAPTAHATNMRIGPLAALVAHALAACIPFSQPESSAPPPSQPASTAATEPLVAGRVYSVEVSPGMIGLESDGRTLVTTSDGSRGLPSRVLTAYPSSGVWRVASESDAHVRQFAVRGHWLALIEYRETGEGGFSEDVVLVDLRTGRRQTIDQYRMSAATYRGGGGAPRRPVGRVILGEGAIAWTRLIEQPAGHILGELRLQRIGDVDSRPLHRSAEWVAPETIAAGRLLYITKGANQDELHLLEIEHRKDTVVAQSAFFFDAALSGRWLLYSHAPHSADRAGPSAVVLRDLDSGNERVVAEGGGRECRETSLNARFAAWICRSGGPASVLAAFELGAQAVRDVVRVVQAGALALELRAVPEGLQWIEVRDGKRFVRTLHFEDTPKIEARDRLRVCVDVASLDPSARPALAVRARQAFALLQSEPIYARAGFSGAPFVVDERCPSPPVLLESGERDPKMGGNPLAVPRVEEPSVYQLFAYLVPAPEVNRMFGPSPLRWHRYPHENVCVPWPGHGQECLEVTTEVYVTPEEAADVERLRERLAEALGLRQPPY
jgi:hypothetical protein